MEKEGRKLYKLDDGQMASRSVYIRQEFKKNRSRGDIAKELDVAYGIVHSATANMTNEVHDGTGRGGGRVVMIEFDGVTMERRQVMRQMFENGKSRSEIAKYFDTPFGTVYQATKDLGESSGRTGGKIMIEWPKGSGEEKARVDVIREMWTSGEFTRRQIANELNCDYAVVWMTTREKSDKDEAGEDVEIVDTGELDEEIEDLEE